MWGLDAGGNINVINDSVVDIRANIYYEYAVCSDKNVYITDSEMLINLSEYEEESIAYTCSISGILYVTNSLLDIYSQGVYVEGISCSKGIEGTDSEINVKVDGNSLKYNYGIYTSDNINLTGCIFNVDVNGAASSVIETKGNIKFIDSNVCLDGDSEDIVGLIAEKNLVVGSSDVTIRAGKQAMNVTGTTTFNSTEEKDSTYIEASKIYKNIGEGEQYQDSEIIKYPGYCDTSYKYVKIGEIPSYYYQYNANTDTVNKVLKNGTTTDVTSILPIGMLIYTDTDGSKYLQLADYSFVTSAAKTLDVVGAATIQLNGVNSLRTVDNSDTVAYGIYADSTLNIKGTGTLDITSIDYGYKTSTNTYKSIYSLGDIFIEDVGINNKIQYNMFSGIEGQNISLVGTSISYDANVQQRGVGMESTGNINITNKSTLQGTMLSDLAESDIKFINVKNGELIVNDSKFDNIVITADKANGIYAEDCNVTLDNTTMDIKITSISTTNYMYSYIIYTNTGGNITIKDSNVVGLLDTGYGLAIGPTQKLLIDNSVVNIDVNEHCKGNQYTLIRGISAVIFEEINSSNITLKISSIKDVWGVSLSNYKAVNGSYMKVDNSSLIIETLGDNAQNKAIYNSGSGDIIITSSNVELRANGIDGRGIMANSKLEVSNSSFISQGTEKSLSIIGNQQQQMEIRYL